MTVSTLRALVELTGSHLVQQLVNFLCLLFGINCLNRFACKFHWEVTQLASHAPLQPGLPISFPSTLLPHSAYT